MSVVRDPSPDAARRVRRPEAAPAPKAPPLKAVPREERSARLRRLRRRALIVLGVATALALVFGLVLVHVQLTAGELRLSSLRNRADAARVENLKLRLRIAQLESPARITSAAQRLGMVQAPSISDITATPGAGVQIAAGASPTPSAATRGWAMAKRVATDP